MKKIRIKFLGLGYNEFYQAYVKIYDLNNELLYKNRTYNSEITLNLKENTIYKVKAKSLNEVICTYIYVSNVESYVFMFDRAKLILNPNRKITFILTDYYYNLPIGKGNLYLWQK